ncbi:hypothetical protein FACS189421_08480 [Bacteroidia bacterium]|nr:hypothetical protein FACS189421_08480 [Bacteroidia bacterium]
MAQSETKQEFTYNLTGLDGRRQIMFRMVKYPSHWTLYIDGKFVLNSSDKMFFDEKCVKDDIWLLIYSVRTNPKQRSVAISRLDGSVIRQDYAYTGQANQSQPSILGHTPIIHTHDKTLLENPRDRTVYDIIRGGKLLAKDLTIAREFSNGMIFIRDDWGKPGTLFAADLKTEMGEYGQVYEGTRNNGVYTHTSRILNHTHSLASGTGMTGRTLVSSDGMRFLWQDKYMIKPIYNRLYYVIHSAYKTNLENKSYAVESADGNYSISGNLWQPTIIDDDHVHGFKMIDLNLNKNPDNDTLLRDQFILTFDQYSKETGIKYFSEMNSKELKMWREKIILARAAQAESVAPVSSDKTAYWCGGRNANDFFPVVQKFYMFFWGHQHCSGSGA